MRGCGRRHATSTSGKDKIIDLDALGMPARQDQHPTQGMSAVAGDAAIATVQARRNLIVHALI